MNLKGSKAFQERQQAWPASCNRLETKISMSTLLNSLNRQGISSSAHPLFPSSQAFLWLPGFSGHAAPFCSYNHRWDSDENSAMRQSHDVPLHPAYPVSQESFIAWNTTVMPPFPYHPVPVVRPLTAAEMGELGEKVAGECQQSVPEGTHPVRNENKHMILLLLAKMGLLASRTDQASSRVA